MLAKLTYEVYWDLSNQDLMRADNGVRGLISYIQAQFFFRFQAQGTCGYGTFDTVMMLF